jgi:hypothetical protein
LLGAYRAEFTLDISADRGCGPEGLQAARELVAVQVQLVVCELDNPAAVFVGGCHGSVPLTRWGWRARCCVRVAAGVRHG